MNLKTLAVGLALTLSPTLALAANPPELIGDWKGVLDIEGMKLTLIWHVGADQVLVDSPDQNTSGLPGDTGRNGSAYTLGIPAVGANFEGSLSADGKTLSGALYQNGGSPSLTLTRVSTTPTLPVFKPAPAEIRGDWTGALTTPNGTMNLAFHLAEKSTADLPGAGTLPLMVDKAGDDYLLSVAGAVFKGKLAADGKTLTGTMGQGGQGGPLTLTRK
jgi:hypothetical protein